MKQEIVSLDLMKKIVMQLFRSINKNFISESNKEISKIIVYNAFVK